MKSIFLALSASLFCLSAPVLAEDKAEEFPLHELVLVDGKPVTNIHFAVFSAQNPTPAGGKPQDQIGILNELVNTFMVANSKEAQELASHPEIAAALEVAQARLLSQALIRDTLESAPVTEQELEEQYKRDYVNSAQEEYKARHILLETKDDAIAIIEALKNGGIFTELAKEKSTGPSKAVGGDLGWFSQDQMVPPFSLATAALNDGAYSEEPVQTQFGWHVILREASRAKEVASIEDIRPQLTKAVRQMKVAKLVNDIRNRTKIQVLDAEGARTVE